MNQAEQLQDQYVKVGSVNTRYWQAGDSGSTVILLHGGGGYIELWKYNILELGATRWRTKSWKPVYKGLPENKLFHQQ